MLYELTDERKDIIRRRCDRVKTLYKQLSALLSKALASGYTRKELYEDTILLYNKPDGSDLSTIISYLKACGLSKNLVSGHVVELMLNNEKKVLLRNVCYSAYRSIRHRVQTKE